MHILRVGVAYLTFIPRDRSTIKGPPPSKNSIHDADCKKNKTMPDFAAVKELVYKSSFMLIILCRFRGVGRNLRKGGLS